MKRSAQTRVMVTLCSLFAEITGVDRSTLYHFIQSRRLMQK